MKLIFTKSYDELKELLSLINGVWDESQKNKKVLRLNGGVMNWYESTGTIHFQGGEEGRQYLESKVKSALSPDEFPIVCNAIPVSVENGETDTPNKEELAPHDITYEYLSGNFDCSEIIIGIVSAVGTETTRVITPLTDRLKRFGYKVEEIKVSSLLKSVATSDEYHRIKNLMNEGDSLRESTKNNAILAYGSAKLIKGKRNKEKTAYIINSLKHPDEVEILRKIYGQGFYLF